uniref:Ig-like domain-containing protein n=1 Tax=Cyclopterus lumpus TaxID=8103 RepID=A0A8C3G3P3_CYCLU
MEHLLWIILAALFSGKMERTTCSSLNTFHQKLREDRVTQSTGDVIATEGQTVTLDCTFETTSNVPTLFWYKQQDNDFPKYMLKGFSKKVFKAPEFLKDRFDASINKTSVPLKIQKLHLSDSAVYYCALSTKCCIWGGAKKLLELVEHQLVETLLSRWNIGCGSFWLLCSLVRWKEQHVFMIL